MANNNLLVLTQFLEDLNSFQNTFLKIDNNGIAYTKEDLTSIISTLNDHIDNHTDQISFVTVNGMNLDDFKSKIFNDLHQHEHTNSSTLDTLTIQIINKFDSKQDAIGYTPLDSSKKGAADGYLPLDATGKVDNSYFPDNYNPTRPYKVVDTHEQLLDLTDSNVCDLVYVTDDSATIPGDQSACYICTKKDPLTFIRYINVDSNGASVSTNWSDITNRPVSAIGDIDDAIAKKHEHTNANVIDKLNESDSGALTYDGKYVHTVSDKRYDYKMLYLTNSTANHVTEVVITEAKPLVYYALYYQGARLTNKVHYNYDDTSKKFTFINGFYIPANVTQDDQAVKVFYVVTKDD